MRLRTKIRRYLRVTNQLYDPVAVIPQRLFNECRDAADIGAAKDHELFGSSITGRKALWFDSRVELITPGIAKIHLRKYQKIKF